MEEVLFLVFVVFFVCHATYNTTDVVQTEKNFENSLIERTRYASTQLAFNF
jgi:hypothetical protein